MELDIMVFLKPLIVSAITAIAGLIGVYAAKFLKRAIEWFKAKIDSVVYNNAIEVAKGLYIYLEDKYNISGMGETKRQEMEQMLLNKFPTLTQEELDSINKSVWLSFNKEWNKKIVVVPNEEPKRLDD